MAKTRSVQEGPIDSAICQPFLLHTQQLLTWEHCVILNMLKPTTHWSQTNWARWRLTKRPCHRINNIIYNDTCKDMSLGLHSRSRKPPSIWWKYTCKVNDSSGHHIPVMRSSQPKRTKFKDRLCNVEFWTSFVTNR